MSRVLCNKINSPLSPKHSVQTLDDIKAKTVFSVHYGSCRSKLLLVLLPPWRCCRLACEELSPSWKNFRLLNVYVWCRDNPGPSGVNRSKGTSAGMSAWLKIVLIKLTDRSPMDQPGRNSPSRLTRGVNQASLHLFTNVASRYKSYTRHLVY